LQGITARHLAGFAQTIEASNKLAKMDQSDVSYNRTRDAYYKRPFLDSTYGRARAIYNDVRDYMVDDTLMNEIENKEEYKKNPEKLKEDPSWLRFAWNKIQRLK
jgi:hypothetical protein